MFSMTFNPYQAMASMKVEAVVFAVFVGVCLGSPVPDTPGDNSHYVDGESQYIWMNDDQGVPRIVDLYQPVEESILRNGANNRYFLYTRQNPTSPREIVHNNVNSIWAANYVATRPLIVVVHGWTGNINSPVNSVITSNVLAVEDVNVLVLDWAELAGANYFTAVFGVPGVGQFLGNFLTWLVSATGSSWNNIHLVGYSLGAHVVGNAGRQTGNRPARITGLDPAGPLWLGNSNALRASDGQYVEAIHTDSSSQGIGTPIADADFFPNGGGRNNNQPGCSTSSCNHSRAYDFFAASIRFNHLSGRLCSNIQQAETNTCSGTALNMGNNVLSKRGNGIYGLVTGASWPF